MGLLYLKESDGSDAVPLPGLNLKNALDVSDFLILGILSHCISHLLTQ